MQYVIWVLHNKKCHFSLAFASSIFDFILCSQVKQQRNSNNSEFFSYTFFCVLSGTAVVNSEVFRAIFSQMLQNSLDDASQCRWTMDPKHSAKATKEFLNAKKWNVLQWPSQSANLNPVEHAFHLLEANLKGKCPNKLKLL